MKQYEAAMKDPKVQEQTQQLQQVMQSPEMMKKMSALRVGRFFQLQGWPYHKSSHSPDVTS